MSDIKKIIFTLLLTVLLLPLGLSYAQEEELPLEEDETLMYQAGEAEDEYTVTIQEDMPVEEDTILYEDYDYNIDYGQIEDMMESVPVDDIAKGTIGAGLLAALAAYALVISLVGIASYVFMALALQKIGKEMNYENAWFAWIPILNMVMVFQLGNQNPWLLLLFLVPVIGQIAVMIFMFIALMNITEKRGYDRVLALLMFVPVAMYVLYYLLAWKPKPCEQKEVTA